MSDLNYIDRTQEVKIAGQDATGLGVNYVSADANGNMLVKDYSDGPVTPGTVASASALIGGQFNTTLPTLTTGQQSAIQLDSSGRQIISPLTTASVIKVDLQDGIGNPLTSTTVGLQQALDVNIADSTNLNINLNGLPNFQTSQYTIGTSATQITATPLANRSSVGLKVTTASNSDVLYIGNSSSVTTSTGYALFNGDAVQFDLTPNTPIWAIGTSSGQKMYVLEIGGG